MNKQSLPDNFLLQHGKYRVERFLSSGGFGYTYKGVHVMMNRPIAIKEFFVGDFCERDEATHGVKVISQTKVDTVAHLKRKFIEEAQSLFSFNHNGIVRVTDIFEENGTAYFVMDFIDGKSLEQIIKERGPLPENEALKYILQTADALAYVHAHNRLHLDVKPANLMIDAAGNAILIDFGVSKQYDSVAGSNTSTLVGLSPGYAPLEQMSNDVTRFSAATDVYSLAATLYALLSGHAPKNAPLLAGGEELDPLPQSVSASTRAAIVKAMSPNKIQRPQSMEEFKQSLSQSQKPASANVPTPTVEDDRNKTVNLAAAPAVSPDSVEAPAEVVKNKKDNRKWALIYGGIVAAIMIVAILIFKLITGGSTDGESDVTASNGSMASVSTVDGMECMNFEFDSYSPENGFKAMRTFWPRYDYEITADDTYHNDGGDYAKFSLVSKKLEYVGLPIDISVDYSPLDVSSIQEERARFYEGYSGDVERDETDYDSFLFIGGEGSHYALYVKLYYDYKVKVTAVASMNDVDYNESRKIFGDSIINYNFGSVATFIAESAEFTTTGDYTQRKALPPLDVITPY